MDAGEEVLMEFNSTRLIFLKWYLGGIVLILAWILLFFGVVGAGFADIVRGYLFVLPLLGFLMIMISELLIRSRRYYISKQRIAQKKGLLSVEEIYVGVNRVAGYTVRQGILDRLFGIGTIEIESVDGEETEEIIMEKVGNVQGIKQLLDNLTSSAPAQSGK